MKNIISKNESGIAHLGLVIVAVALLAVVGFGVMRVVSQNSNGSSQVSQSDDGMEKDLNDSSDDGLDGTDNVEDGNE